MESGAVQEGEKDLGGKKKKKTGFSREEDRNQNLGLAY